MAGIAQGDRAPRDASVLREATQVSGGGQFGAIQAVAPSLGVEVRPIGMRDAGEIERGINTFAREPKGGLIVGGGTSSVVHLRQIITLAARHHLPAVYYYRYFVAAGGLVSYGLTRTTTTGAPPATCCGPALRLSPEHKSGAVRPRHMTARVGNCELPHIGTAKSMRGPTWPDKGMQMRTGIIGLGVVIAIGLIWSFAAMSNLVPMPIEEISSPVMLDRQ
jgi:hypothetical protein